MPRALAAAQRSLLLAGSGPITACSRRHSCTTRHAPTAAADTRIPLRLLLVMLLLLLV